MVGRGHPGGHVNVTREQAGFEGVVTLDVGGTSADIGVAPFDVAAHPPLAQDFYWSPLKIFEYMAVGLPVVAPALPRLKRLIDDGHEGVLEIQPRVEKHSHHNCDADMDAPLHSPEPRLVACHSADKVLKVVVNAEDGRDDLRSAEGKIARAKAEDGKTRDSLSLEQKLAREGVSFLPPTLEVRKELEKHFRDVSADMPFYRRVKVLRFWDAELPRTSTRKVKRKLVVEELKRLVPVN